MLLTGLLVLFSCKIQDHQPRGSTAHTELNPLTSIKKTHRRHVHRPVWWGRYLDGSFLFQNCSSLCQVDIKAHEHSSDGDGVYAKSQICPLPSAEAQNCSGYLRAPRPGHTGDREMYSQAPGELEGLLSLRPSLSGPMGAQGMELAYTTGCVSHPGG